MTIFGDVSSSVEVSKVGDWKTIDQRELKASGARKKQRRALKVTGAAGAAGAALAARNPQGTINAARGLSRARSASDVARVARQNPTGTAAVGAGAAAAGGLGFAGSQRGVEGYHQHKINQRRRNNQKKRVSKAQGDERLKGTGTLGTGLALAGAGPAIRTGGNQLISRGNRGMRNAASQGGNSSFGQGASQGAQRAMNRGHRTMRAGKTLRRASRVAPVAGGAIAGAGAMRMAQDHRDRRNQDVAKKDKSWSDRRYQGQKKAQSAISTTAGTLGVAALGALAATKGKNPKVAALARRSSTPLSTASVGVGGVGSFNFAATSAEEARRAKRESGEKNKARVSKADSVPHGMRSPVSGVPNSRKLATQTLSGQNRNTHQRRRLTQVAKVSSVERKRMNRLDRYENAALVGGAAAGAAGARNAAGAARGSIQSSRPDRTVLDRLAGQNKGQGLGQRTRAAAKAGRKAVNTSDKRLLAAAGAAGLGAAAINRYKNTDTTQPYRPLPL